MGKQRWPVQATILFAIAAGVGGIVLPWLTFLTLSKPGIDFDDGKAIAGMLLLALILALLYINWSNAALGAFLLVDFIAIGTFAAYDIIQVRNVTLFGDQVYGVGSGLYLVGIAGVVGTVTVAFDLLTSPRGEGPLAAALVLGACGLIIASLVVSGRFEKSSQFASFSPPASSTTTTTDPVTTSTSSPTTTTVWTTTTIAQFGMPDLLGTTAAEASTTLAADGLIVGLVNNRCSDQVARGLVVSTSPVAGAFVIKGTSVALSVSTGVCPINVPDVLGETVSVAESTLTSAQLQPRAVLTCPAGETSTGKIAYQSPSPPAKVRAGRVVTIEVGCVTGPSGT